VPALQRLEHTVTGIDRRAYAGNDVDEFIHADLLNQEATRAACAEQDLVVHLAAAKDDWGISREEFFRDNLDATQRLVEEGKEAGVEKWIFYSSVAAYGPSDRPLDENADMNPASAYGESKVEGERLFRQLAQDTAGIQALILRPSVIYGPGHFSYTNIHRLIEAIRRRRFLMVGDGSAVKTTSYIENLVSATIFAMQNRMEEGVESYIYVDEPVRSTEELVDDIYRLLGKTRLGVRVPLQVAVQLTAGVDVLAEKTGINFPITSSRIEKFNTSTNYDASAIREAGFTQTIGHEAALQRTIDWHRRHVP
jgi:nucleoside-diphosphate-sugar epimerase